jgi:hypothetical protein
MPLSQRVVLVAPVGAMKRMICFTFPPVKVIAVSILDYLPVANHPPLALPITKSLRFQGQHVKKKVQVDSSESG